MNLTIFITLHPMSVDPWQLEEPVSDYLKKSSVVHLVDCAALTILIYDYFLTFGSEVSYVWTCGPWNLGKVLFFLVRYPVIVAAGLLFYVDKSHPVLSTCSLWVNAGFYSTICVIMIIEFVFALRVWALWGRSRKVAICLAVVFAVTFIIGLYKAVMIRETQGAFEIRYYQISGGQCPPQFSGEDGGSNGSTITFGFITIATYELVILILTLIKASKQGWLGSHGSGSHFINGFLSQGVAYNCLILVASTANIIVRYKLSSAYVNLLVNIQPVIHSVLTSRMMLYLRKNTFQCQASSTNDSLTGILAVAPHLLESTICYPSASCPQISISFLDSGAPLTSENEPV
ncbi:hypothetical protein L218DRAFT_1075736 [Marasmius fiardii PR-910]|nr:hypothetical protein L218DRAFT_1075736 [Marasmius fiardii PR-910]